MKNSIKVLKLFSLMVLVTCYVFAQQPPIQNFRPYDQRGINVFETPKTDTVPYTGFKVRLGVNSSFTFQNLDHESVIVDTFNSDGYFIDLNADKTDDRSLFKLSNGFNLAMANLNIDAQLYDGIHMNLVTYLSSRHHQEAWVKGGFVQFDKLTFLKSPFIDNAMKYLTIKFGDYEVNYGDQHYRRSDAGNSVYNPFIENLIMDEFTTEIGGELQVHVNEFIGVFGMTGGEIKGDVSQSSTYDANTDTFNRRAPSIIGKIGYDSQLSEDLRIRLTGSVYTTKSSANNTIFGGDRTGSHYFAVMEKYNSTYADAAFSGRLNPGFNDQVTAFMINPFIKFMGLEVFGTLEFANGRKVTEEDSMTESLIGQKRRQANQYAVEVIYRFPANQNFWVAGRYNTVNADMLLSKPTMPVPLTTKDYTNDIQNVTVNRIAVSAGWFIIKNVMVKAEYVSQMYKDFPTYDIRHEGSFDGLMIEAVLGF